MCKDGLRYPTPDEIRNMPELDCTEAFTGKGVDIPICEHRFITAQISGDSITESKAIVETICADCGKTVTVRTGFPEFRSISKGSNNE